MRKHVLSLVLALVLCLSLAAPSLAAGTESKNINQQEYTNGRRWSKTVKSYLYENENGGLTRVEYVNDQVLIEDYDDAFILRSSKTIAPELPIWGGFFAGEDFNFLIFGQDNKEEDNGKEVIRVVKYDKNWHQLGKTSLYGANTTEIFSAGSLRCDEYGGWLYVRTCHKMYTGSDGLNHQANLMLAVRQSDMTITDSFFLVEANVGYVSHSFNQFILVDHDGHIVTLDHGDAYPRGALLQRYVRAAGQESFQSDIIWSPTGDGTYTGSTEETEILTFPTAEVHYNDTGASLGGLAETSNGYVAAYNFDGTASDRGKDNRDMYLGFVNKELNKTTSVRLTNGTDTSAPQLVSTGLDGGYVMWNEHISSVSGDTLYYTAYDANGQVDDIKSATASLSDCKPVYWNGKAVWYVTDNSAPVFFLLDSAGVQTVVTNAADRFDDVAKDAYYNDPVVWAINKNVTQGTGENTFSPDKPCTVAEILTFLWRAAGKPEPKNENPFTNTASDDYYYKAALWAHENELVSGTVFAADTPCTRSMVVTFLWKLAGQPDEGMSGFEDVPADADFARAVSWAVNHKITSGTGDNRFEPDRACTRAEIVTFLYRYFA